MKGRRITKQKWSFEIDICNHYLARNLHKFNQDNVKRRAKRDETATIMWMASSWLVFALIRL
ncbi:hypothetical protein OUZ56_021953 [Daphnia magna]|uniref:Transposase n=1 Tax=Daphnia magna TaxID=35525 RepID=A0ABR0AV19_9CRUS|nr:hypothetical protein OUZ56_021953 [Daphnia magna]